MIDHEGFVHIHISELDFHPSVYVLPLCSVPFLVSISFSTTIFLLHPASLIPYYNQFLSSFSIPHSEIPPAGKSQLIEFLYPLLSPIFNVYLVTSTTRSTVHKFHDRAIKFVSSLKYILISFFPLLSPKLVHMIILGLILFAFGIFMLLQYTMLVLPGCNMDYNSVYFLVFMLLQYTMLVLPGCNMDYNSVYFLVFIFRIAAFLAGLLIYFGAEWCLMNQMRGFSPLKYLVKGTRGVAFLMMMLSGLVSGILSMWYMVLMANYAGNNSHGPTGWLVVQIVVYAVFMVTLLSYNHVVETVFLRLLHGEIASDW